MVLVATLMSGSVLAVSQMYWTAQASGCSVQEPLGNYQNHPQSLLMCCPDLETHLTSQGDFHANPTSRPLLSKPGKSGQLRRKRLFRLQLKG